MSFKISSAFCLFLLFSMASSNTLVQFDVSPFLPLFENDDTQLSIPFFLNLYKNNTIERLQANFIIPPGVDPLNGVQSKDVVISAAGDQSIRIFIPKTAKSDQKLPLLVYTHGGGFICGSAFDVAIFTYLNSLVAKAEVVAVSVSYRLAPETPIPGAYEDAWSALKWIVSHSNGNGNEAWLKDYVDFEQVFLAGESAGANIAHNVAMRVGQETLEGAKLAGMVLISPFFWGQEAVGEHEPRDVKQRKNVENMWHVACGMRIGLDEPQINPILDPKLPSLGCTRALVCIAEKDMLRDRGEYYAKALVEKGWKGDVQLMETKGENHVFHLGKPTSEKAKALLNKVASFLKTT